MEKPDQQQTPADLPKADVVPAVENDVASCSSFLTKVPMDVASSPSSSQAEVLLTDSPAPKETPLPPAPVGFSPAASNPRKAPGEAAPKKGERRDERGKASERRREAIRLLLGMGLLAPPSTHRLQLLSIS